MGREKQKKEKLVNRKPVAAKRLGNLGEKLPLRGGPIGKMMPESASYRTWAAGHIPKNWGKNQTTGC